MSAAILGLSVFLQFLAAALSLRLIKITGRWEAWGLIALAMSLMAIRRSITLYRVLSGDVSLPPDLTAELVALLISVLMLFGVIFIGPMFRNITKINQELQQRERMLADSQRASGLGVCGINLVDGSAWWSDEMYQRFGFSRDTFTPSYDKFFDNIHPDEIARVREAMNVFQASESEEEMTLEYRLVMKDRDVMHIRTVFTPVKDSQAKTVSCQCVSQDITDIIKTRTTLNLYESLVSASSDFICVVNEDYEYVLANQPYLEILEKEKHDVIGRPVVEVMDEEAFNSVFRPALDKAFAGDISRAVIERDWADSGPRVMDIVYYRFIDPEGSGKYVSCIGRDISAVKQTEAALKESEQQLIEAQQIARVGNWYFNMVTGAVDWSDEVYRTFGLTREEVPVLSRERFLEMVHPDDREKLRAGIAAAFGGEEENEDEYRIVRSDGEIRTINSRRKIFKDSEGKVIAIAGVVRDITEQKSLEKQLLQSQKMEAIGQLAGGIAHDFNNILQSMIGYSHLCSKLAIDLNNERMNAYLAEIISGGERASKLVKDMLVFSRAEPEAVKAVHIEGTVRDTVKLLTGMLLSSIEIQLDIEENLPPVKINPVQLEQMLMNLCINARDAMHELGTLIISVKKTATVGMQGLVPRVMAKDSAHRNEMCFCEGEAGNIHPADFLEISVQDMGGGIAEKELEHIFEPFFTTKPMTGGTGMGLAMIHGIMKNAGGHIIVETEEARGSVFRLLFTPSEEEFSGGDELEPVTESSPATLNKHILLVDDEESILTFMEALLEDQDYEVTKCSNGEDALSRFEASKDKYDLVITDQTMPKMTGTELCKKLLALRPNLPVILCSGYSELIDENAAIEQGISVYLKKPASPKDLLAAIENVLA